MHMKSKLWLSTFRLVKETLGRYLALMAIVAIGVGFFSGLRVTDIAMRNSMNVYLIDNQFYDYRLISTLGFEDKDIEELSKEENVRACEGAVFFDAIVDIGDANSQIIRFQSITADVNKLVITAGRLPEADDECVVDSNIFSEEQIGQSITISSNNDGDTRNSFKHQAYKIVGIAQSPLYIQYERGNTSIGDGVIDAACYVNKDAFDVDYYTECYVKLDSDFYIYSDEYVDLVDDTQDKWQSKLEQVAMDRYNRIVSDATVEIEDAKAELNEAQAKVSDAEKELADGRKKLADERASFELQMEKSESELAALKEKIDQANSVNLLMPGTVDAQTILYMTQQYDAGAAQLSEGRNQAEKEFKAAEAKLADGEKELEDAKLEISDGQAKVADGENELADIKLPDTYLLGRTENIGYNCFESDSSIVGAIGKVFPVFFFLVAALVCMTTMNRMVEDQRTQIGVLKALGYRDGQIMATFACYSGSSAFVGAVLGFFGGTVAFPQAIWYAYQMMYSTRGLDYYFSPAALMVSFAVAMLCSVGVTLLTCRYEMFENAAGLMRPKAPKAGKRIFLEYVPFIWNRLKFLNKVSLRNIFRYKGRLFMMILGLGGCTALLATGFGIYDSIADIAENQYNNISTYDIVLSLKDGTRDDQVNVLEEMGYSTEDYYLFYETAIDLTTASGSKNVYLDVYDSNSDITPFFSMHTEKGKELALPSEGEAIINASLADKYDISIGDSVELSSENIPQFTVKVVGINQNFIYNYVYVNTDTIIAATGEAPLKKNVYLNIKDGEDPHDVSAALMDDSRVAAETATIDLLDRISSMMKSLNIIVYLVIGSAAALCFVVVYNLSNINIAERVREIATVKVLGFYQNETYSYIFKENMILSAMGGFVGLFLGKAFHAYVMSGIVVDLITFDVKIRPLSYLLSFGLTIFFTFLVNFIIRKKIDDVSMTESLKAVE